MIWRVVSLPLRKLDQLLSNTLSFFKKNWLRLIYPGVTIKGNTYISKRCKINCTNDATMILDNVHVSDGVMLVARHGGRLEIRNTFIGENSVIACMESISIERDCMIAEMVVIRDQNHRVIAGQSIRDSGFVSKPISIGKNVWLGAKSTVLMGVTIGGNSIIGAHALVNSNIPENSVAVGVPAQTVKSVSAQI